MRIVRVVVAVVLVLVLLLAVVLLILRGGRRLESMAGEPLLPGTVLETVADLDYPPGNVAVSAGGRVFFTLHPDGNPPGNVYELVDGAPVPYPSEAFQKPGNDLPYFQSVLSLRIDRQGRLWTLDHARFSRGQPRLLAFDLTSGAIVHRYDFPRSTVPFLSMLNDFQVDPSGRRIYIADASPILHRPAIVTYDVETRESRRLLAGHPSVHAADFVLQAPGRDMIIFGLVPMRVPVDSIALDERGEWLYYGPLTGDRMYRVAARDLDDPSLDDEELGRRVEDYGPKPLSDGLAMDRDDNIYVSDMASSAVLTLGPDRQLRTVVQDARLRWPDGFGFGPDGWLYVTCSALHQVLFLPERSRREHAPYQIYRFRPGGTGTPGH
jgi:sugar lactone lactonase YvrE